MQCSSVLEAIYLQQMMVEDAFSEGGELYVDDDAVRAYLDENYVRAKHILILTEGITDEAELAEKKAQADELLGLSMKHYNVKFATV